MSNEKEQYTTAPHSHDGKEYKAGTPLSKMPAAAAGFLVDANLLTETSPKEVKDAAAKEAKAAAKKPTK